MIQANQLIFSRLIHRCEKEEVFIDREKSRWIKTKRSERNFIINSLKNGEVRFSKRLTITRFDYHQHNYFFVFGFANATPPNMSFNVCDVDAGIATVALSETDIEPVGTTSEIRNIVEYSSRDDDPEYDGHGYGGVISLFPNLTVFRCDQLEKSETHKAFFQIALVECKLNDSWINEELADSLLEISGLGLPSIPYETLCRSVMDTDPSSMFLALYRCLEAIYSYSAAMALGEKLDVTRHWTDIAFELEDTLGWYPREEDSLVRLFSHGIEIDFKRIFASTNQALPDEGSDLARATARLIYKLRNQSVHYRPKHMTPEVVVSDWNALCEALSLCVCNIYGEIDS